MLVRQCYQLDELRDASFVASWLQEMLAHDLRLHAVARLPQGYQPDAGHLIILIHAQNPYNWPATGLFEREGEIVGLTTGCEAEALYPPSGYLLPPPVRAEELESRRSGHAVVDAFLDALRDGNESAVSDLIEYLMVPCVSHGYPGSPPVCPDGVALGTPVEAIQSGCHGNYVAREGAPSMLVSTLQGMSVYSVVDLSRDGAGLGLAEAAAVLGVAPGSPHDADPRLQRFGAAVTVIVSETHVIEVKPTGCTTLGGIWLTGGSEPSFLLPPP